MDRSSLRLRVSAALVTIGLAPLVGLWLWDRTNAAALWIALAWLPAVLFTAELFVRPVQELAAVAERLRRGELEARPAGRLPDPLAAVAASLADLAERLDRTNRHFEQEVRARTEELQRKANQLRALGQVGQQVAAVLEPSELLHFVVRVVRGTFAYDVVAVVQDEGAHLVLSACAVRGRSEVPLGRVFAASDADVASIVEGMLGDGAVSDRPCRLIEGIEARSQLTAPIRLGERTIGAIVVQSLAPAAFDDDDLFTVRTIAGQVAVALENARLLAAERELRGLAITEERNRIAREIHDTLAQGFMGILMHLRAMRGASGPEAAELHRAQAELLAQEGLEEARRSVWNLRPERLVRRGLAGALQDEVERLQKRAGLHVALRVSGDTEGLPAPVAAGLLRIAQESLHNTLRHARASRAEVELTVGPDGVTLTVSDDGVGFDPAAPPRSSELGGFGLRGMYERARLLGGELTVDTAPNQGTRITVRIPTRPFSGFGSGFGGGTERGGADPSRRGG